MIDRLFHDHPRSAGQTCWQHLDCAWRFGGSMAIGAIAAIVPGLVPIVCQHTDDSRVREVHQRLSRLEPANER
jgi:hypothetical protein